jgi:hypothetical protein
VKLGQNTSVQAEWQSRGDLRGSQTAETGADKRGNFSPAALWHCLLHDLSRFMTCRPHCLLAGALIGLIG